MANRYDTNEILDRIADALDDDQNSALIASLEDIKTAIENGGGGGGGGGGAAYTAELIYSNPSRTIENTVTLDNPYTDYNYLVFEISDSSAYTHKLQTMVVLKEQMDDAKANNILLCYYQAANSYLQYTVTDNTTLTKNNAAYECIVNIYGIKITGAGGGGDPHNEMIATEFSPSSTYAFGDYCIHNDTYYKCINAINTPGAWDITDWQATNVGNELSALNSNLQKSVTLTPASGVTTVYSTIAHTGKLVGGAARLKCTASANTFTTVGTISSKPTDTFHSPFALGSGSYGGIIKIDTSGTIQVYSLTSLNQNNIDFMFAYGSNT